MSYAYKQNQKQQIVGAIQSLVNELQQLAPHPDRADFKGPLFLKGNANFQAANDHDGMLGAMMLEGMLGLAVSEFASEAANDFMNEFDISNALDAYSEYVSDVEGSTLRNAAHGQGTMAKMSGTSISGGFNVRSNITEGMQAFYEDLPKRMTIERSLAHYARELAMLDAPAPQHAAPRPSFAA